MATDKNTATLFCPLVAFMTLGATKARRCGREKCAWWDESAQMCIVKTIASLIAAVAGRLDDILTNMPKDR